MWMPVNVNCVCVCVQVCSRQATSHDRAQQWTRHRWRSSRDRCREWSTRACCTRWADRLDWDTCSDSSSRAPLVRWAPCSTRTSTTRPLTPPPSHWHTPRSHPPLSALRSHWDITVKKIWFLSLLLSLPLTLALITLISLISLRHFLTINTCTSMRYFWGSCQWCWNELFLSIYLITISTL